MTFTFDSIDISQLGKNLSDFDYIVIINLPNNKIRLSPVQLCLFSPSLYLNWNAFSRSPITIDDPELEPFFVSILNLFKIQKDCPYDPKDEQLWNKFNHEYMVNEKLREIINAKIPAAISTKIFSLAVLAKSLITDETILINENIIFKMSYSSEIVRSVFKCQDPSFVLLKAFDHIHLELIQ
jgi:hypothetical protein